MKTVVVGSSIYYQRAFSQDLKKRCNMVFMDHRGFCPDGAETDFSVGALVAEIEGFRKTQRLGKIVLLGHSIHALMAAAYARAYPEHVEALILVGASPISGEALRAAANRCFEESVSPERHARLAENLARLSEPGEANPFVRRMCAFGPMLWHDSSFDAASLWEGVRFHSEGAAQIWGDAWSEEALSAGFEGIKCPVFLALGRDDFFNPPHLWDPFRAQFSDLTVRVFEKSGHSPMLEEPEAFSRELCEYLYKYVKKTTNII